MHIMLHAPLSKQAFGAMATAWVLDQCPGPKRPLPLGPVSHPVLVLTLQKPQPAWWYGPIEGHPSVRPQDFDFMVNDDD